MDYNGGIVLSNIVMSYVTLQIYICLATKVTIIVYLERFYGARVLHRCWEFIPLPDNSHTEEVASNLTIPVLWLKVKTVHACLSSCVSLLERQV